jgi:hypothetical protein
MQIGKDLNEALDGLLAGIDSLLADRDLTPGVAGTPTGQLPVNGPLDSASGEVDHHRSAAPPDVAILSALALACQSQTMGRDAQQTYRALLRKALQERAQSQQSDQVNQFKGLIRQTSPVVLSPRWLHWLIKLGRSGEIRLAQSDRFLFVPDQPLDADDWAVLSTVGPLSILVQAACQSSLQSVDLIDLRLESFELPLWPELQPVPAGCALEEVMPIAERDQQSSCLIYWLDHWLPSHPTVLGLALPLRPMPALSELSWSALVRATTF